MSSVPDGATASSPARDTSRRAHGSFESSRGGGGGASSSGEGAASSSVDGDGRDESFSSSLQRMAISVMAPSLLLLKRPFRWFLFVVFICVVVGVGVGFLQRMDCTLSAPRFEDVWLYRYYKVLRRQTQGDDPGWYDVFPDDLGDPICVYHVVAWGNNSTKPLTLDRPWVEQEPEAGEYGVESCDPVPYADGTPHFFDVIWQQATGRPREDCAGWGAGTWNWKRTPCRPFSSSSAQKEALRAAIENLDVSRDKEERAKNFFSMRRFGFTVRFQKCPTPLVVVSAVLPVVLAVLGGSLLIVIVVKVITRSKEGIFQIPSPVGNYQEILRLERQQRHFAKWVEEELREVKNRHTNAGDRPGAEENATGGQPVSSAPAAAPAGGQEHSRTSYGSIGEAGGAAIRESAAESVAPPPLETPVRRRRASTDISD